MFGMISKNAARSCSKNGTTKAWRLSTAPSRATKIRSCHQRRSPSWKKDSSPKNCNEIIRTPLVTSGTGRSKSEAEGGIQVKDGDQRGYELGFGAFIRAGQAAGL